ncbi:hypothetical protein MTO96_045711, partial [Rhipicephalus appendiculatus]
DVRLPQWNFRTNNLPCNSIFAENLEISSSPEVITHPDVGKYFERFCGTHYLPNAEKEHEYPEDAEVRDKLLLQTSHSGSDEEEEDEEESCSI